MKYFVIEKKGRLTAVPSCLFDCLGIHNLNVIIIKCLYLHQIEAYLADVAATDTRTTLASLGLTIEGREMWQLKVSVGAGKQSVWFDCGIHARE